jgi:hypothetical protein
MKRINIVATPEPRPVGRHRRAMHPGDVYAMDAFFS